MATATPIYHPRRDVSKPREARFPYRVSVKRMGRGGVFSAVTGKSDLPAAYEPAQGARPEMFQDAAPAMDKVLLLGWHPTILPKDQIILLRPDGTQEGVFVVDDRVPGDSGPTRTLLTLMPEGAQ